MNIEKFKNKINGMKQKQKMNKTNNCSPGQHEKKKMWYQNDDVSKKFSPVYFWFMFQCFTYI